MGLDYGWTCGNIDAGISESKEAITDTVKDLLEKYSELDGEQIEDIAESESGYLYRELESVFEGVRSTNEDMRKEADRQIDQLEGEVEDLKQQLDCLTSEIESLNDELNSALT